MEKDNFFKNSFLLTSSNIATGILGFIFSIYLSKILGAEGMGLYNLVMPVYHLFICLMTSGIVAAISKISAVYHYSNEYGNLNKTIKTVSIFNIIWAICIGLFVFFFAPIIAKFGIHDIRTINAIRVACPAMIFISLSNILKGYFLGTSQIKVPALIDIFEKAMRLVTIFLLLYTFKTNNLTLLVTLAYVSLAIGELQSLIFLYLYYKKCTKNIPYRPKVKTEGRLQLLFNVLIISFPLCLNGFLNGIFSTVSTWIVPQRLIHAGFDYNQALALIGKYTGMAMTLIGIPLIVVGTINTLIIPDLSQTLNQGRSYDAIVRIRKVLKLAFILGLATTVICNLVPGKLGEIFYARDDLGNFIKMASLSAPLFFCSTTMFGILNGLSKQGIILRNSIVIAVFELISLFIFTSIPSINIYGFSITLFFSSALCLLLNLYEINRCLNLNLSVINIIIFILVAILIYLLFNLLIRYFLLPLTTIKTLSLVFLIFATFALSSKLGTN
ncbi:stage V sporulation protein B [uncultured Clostridium sp.]|uniref:stage V sporulation protein B n=1 Tax=uncultured Clostridium sp. TaxID=59620 RepID=UPI002611D120|nr:stage V sporulation protein B [uncultured Clostridium sp.]